MKLFVRGLIGLVCLLTLWQLASAVGLFPENYLPPPSVVLPLLVELLAQEEFLRHVIATVLAWAIALGIAAAVAIPAGLILGSIHAVRVATRTVIEFLRPIPSVALIPLAIVLIGAGPETKISLAVYAAVWPILFNTIYALDEIDPLLLDTAKSFGTSRTQVLLSVSLPHAAPFVFTGIRMASTVALIVVISVEYVAGGRLGIGKFTLEASSGSGRQDLVLAATLLAGLIGYLIDGCFVRAQRSMLRWSVTEARTS